MILSYNKIIGLPLISNHNGKKLGKVEDLIINPENGKFLGLIILMPRFFSKKIAVLINDIKNIDTAGVIIKNENILHSLDDLDNLVKKIVLKKIKIKNNKVLTKSGDNLGEVRDFEIDTNYNIVSKIYVSGGIIKDLIRRELIISRSQIISINKKAIVVKDIIIKSKKPYKLIGKEKKLAVETGLFIKLNG